MEKSPQRSHRISKLDGLRGILALMVTLNHAYMVVAIPAFANIWEHNIFAFHDLQSKLQQIMMLLGNGGLAVTTFFVLSGFVLGESARRQEFTIGKTIAFYIRRLIRLYPVYLLLIVVSAIYMWTGFKYQTFAASSQWYNWWMNFQMTIPELIRNLTFYHTYLGGVTWTLRVIIIASFLFPLMFFVFRRVSRYVSLFITLLLVAGCFTVFNLPNFNDLRYLYMFYFGLTLPQWKNFFVSVKPSQIHVLAVPLIFLAFYIRYISNIFQAMVLETLITWLLIGILAYNGKVFAFLDKKIFQFLGRISYSLYLVNFTVLYIFARLVFFYVPSQFLLDNYFLSNSIIFLITLCLTVVISVGVHRFIEKPAQLLSRKVGLK